MTVEVGDWDPTALDVFAFVRDSLAVALPDHEIEHIGSTSVPGLRGKGIVDVMVLARDDADTATIAERLVALGLQHARGSRPERPFLLGGVDRDGATTYIHIHVIDLHLPGPPVSVVADDDNAIQAAVGRMWPASSGPAPYLFLCEHHLRERAKAALTRDNANAGRGRWMTRLDTAFRRPEGWEEFADACGELADAKAWASTNDTRISAQVAARDRLPAHYSTAAVDAAAQQLRGMFEHRSFALRNARRTNLLLGLAQLHLNNTDDPDTYHRILREHAERAGGQPAAPQRRGATGTTATQPASSAPAHRGNPNSRLAPLG